MTENMVLQSERKWTEKRLPPVQTHMENATNGSPSVPTPKGQKRRMQAGTKHATLLYPKPAHVLRLRYRCFDLYRLRSQT